MKEIEVKARIDNADELVKKAQNFGFCFTEVTTQKDIIFLPEGIKFSEIRSGVPVVRVRNQNGQKITLTLKKRLENELNKIEHEIVASDDVEAAKILENLNLYEVVRVDKNRREGHFNDLGICIDEVEGLGSFVEMEKLCEEGDGLKIQAELFALLKSFGVKDEDRVHNGYDTLIYNKLNPIR